MQFNHLPIFPVLNELVTRKELHITTQLQEGLTTAYRSGGSITSNEVWQRITQHIQRAKEMCECANLQLQAPPEVAVSGTS